jgi:3-hydroxybutyryl-CoA dehydrogenase
VVGTGRIAPGVAAAFASAAADVVIVGRNEQRAEQAARRASALAAAQVGAGGLQRAEFVGADLVVECVVEDLAVKRQVLIPINEWLPDGALLTTNTSGLSIASLAENLRGDRFAGLHFLHPAEATAVVELVPGPATSNVTLGTLVELIERMGRHPIVLRKEIPGFVWNRLQFAVLRECLYLLDEGVADMASIDAAVSDGLAPRWLAGGPFATAQLGGLRTFRRVADHLFPTLSTSASVSPSLVGDDREGFYEWTAASRDGIEELRSDALRLGRGLTERRRTHHSKRSDETNTSGWT